MIIVGIVGWLVVGLLVGFIATKVVNLRGDDPLLGYGAACGGALVAAVLYTLISGAGITSFNIWSLIYAAIGSVVTIVTWHMVRSRFVSREAYTTRRSY